MKLLEMQPDFKFSKKFRECFFCRCRNIYYMANTRIDIFSFLCWEQHTTTTATTATTATTTATTAKTATTTTTTATKTHKLTFSCFVLAMTTTTHKLTFSWFFLQWQQQQQQHHQQQYGEHINWHFFRFDDGNDGASFWVKVQTNVNRASSYRKCKKVIIIIFDVNSTQLEATLSLDMDGCLHSHIKREKSWWKWKEDRLFNRNKQCSTAFLSLNLFGRNIKCISLKVLFYFPAIQC